MFNRLGYFVTSSAEENPQVTDYFSLEDDQMHKLSDKELTVLYGCTTSIINDLDARGQNTDKYKNYFRKVKGILNSRGVHILDRS